MIASVEDAADTIWAPLVLADPASTSRSAFAVRIQGEISGTAIRYTIDGSRPIAGVGVIRFVPPSPMEVGGLIISVRRPPP